VISDSTHFLTRLAVNLPAISRYNVVPDFAFTFKRRAVWLVNEDRRGLGKIYRR